MVWLILLLLLLTLLYLKAIRPLSYWKDRGVPHKKGLPLLGNAAVLLMRNKPFFTAVEDVYNEFRNVRYYGMQQFNKPTLCVRDLDLIKRITVKDFDYFMDHNGFIVEDTESLMSKNLINLKGETWRQMRATLSPSFTSSKMKSMFLLISECAQLFVEHFEKKNNEMEIVEIKEIVTRFTNDAIASIAFGFKCDSLKDQTNEFYTMGKKATEIGGIRFLLVSFLGLFPFLQKVFKVDLLSSKISTFFRQVIKETINKREHEGLVRPDMIHLLLEARKGKVVHDEPEPTETSFAAVEESKTHHVKLTKLELTDDDITAQALIFFFGGFETSSILLSFAAYELAVNQEVQEKLQAEIDDCLNECDGKVTYTALQKTNYLDMVISETLRKWPPGFQLDRRCVKDYVIEAENPDEKTFTVENGTMVVIPVVGIHHDPQHFENPGKFDPERFNEENKGKIKPYSYLPFGSGPRNCIASRFALLETKTLIFYILSKFNLKVIAKTQIPLKLSKKTININAENGIWLGLERRKS